MEIFVKRVRFSLFIFLAVIVVTVSSNVSFAAGTEKAADSENSLVEIQAVNESQTNETEIETETETKVDQTKIEKDFLDRLKNIKLNLGKTSYTYTGSAICPDSYILKETVDKVEKDVTSEFILDTKSAKCTNNTNVGKATVSVPVTGYIYKGKEFKFTTVKSIYLKADFNIKAFNFYDKDVSLSASSFTYDGTSKTPKVTVKVTINGKNTTLESSYYTVKYSKNINAGTATVTVTGKGNFAGSNVTKTFKINKLSVSKVTSTVLSATGYTYDGTEKKPKVTLKHKVNGKYVTISSSNYTVKYSGNVNSGTAKVTVTGKTNLTGSLNKYFKINPKNIASGKVTLSSSSYKYDGKSHKPGVKVSVKLNSKLTKSLKNKSGCTVSYSKNTTSIGTKNITIKGTGNYTGTIHKTYKVIPETATGLKVSNREKTSLTYTCSKAKVKGCKYEFMLKKYNASSKKWYEVKTVASSSNSIKFTGLSSGCNYAVYVRIYKKDSNGTYKGAWCKSVKACTTPSAPVINSVAVTSAKVLKVSWKAVSNATGYEVQYSTDANFKSNVKSVKVNGKTTTSAYIKLNSSNNYYARVRAYCSYNGKYYNSSYSSKLYTAYSNVYASYTTTYSTSNYGRSTNLRVACNEINGTILGNGDTFSFNNVVGPRTTARGYKEAIVYSGGKEVSGVGGGICQVASTLFNAALRANFTITERHQHSLTVHYVPLGYDAAIAGSAKNLKFINNSGTTIKVQASASGGVLSMKFISNISKKPPTVTTKVTVSNGVYTLRRYVNGTCNYRTSSDYLNN